VQVGGDEVEVAAEAAHVCDACDRKRGSGCSAAHPR
jgi:hypothetical protein